MKKQKGGGGGAPAPGASPPLDPPLIVRVTFGPVLDKQSIVTVEYVLRLRDTRPNDVKSPSVSWDSIFYVAGFYVDLK